MSLPNLSPEIAFIDASLSAQEKADIIAGLRPGIEYYELSAAADGISQVLAVLEGRTGIAALHLYSEGSAGRFALGAGVVDTAVLSGAAAATMAAWAPALAVGADILVYACDAGAAGPALADRIAALTGADVAMSVDRTGAAARGGDWDLELTRGVINTGNALTAAAAGSIDVLLAAPTVEIASATENGVVLFILGSYDPATVAGLQVSFGNYVFTGVPNSTNPDHQSVVLQGGQWYLSWTLDIPLPPAVYEVTVRVTDSAGTPLTTGVDLVATGQLEVFGAEFLPPTLATAEVAADGSSVTLSGSYDALVSGLRVRLVNGNTPVFAYSSLTQPELFVLDPLTGNWQFFVDQLALAPATYQVTVEVVDGAGQPVSDAGGAPLAATDALVVSPPDPTYALSSDVVNVDEGGTITFTLQTTNVAAGTLLDYTLDGGGITADDVLGGQLAGSVVVGTDGAASFTVQLVADQLTEDVETLTATLMGQSASVAIHDTSTSVLSSALVLRAGALINGVATFELWLRPGASVVAGQIVLAHDPALGSFSVNSLVAAPGLTPVLTAGTSGSMTFGFSGAAPVGGIAATRLMTFSYDVNAGAQQFGLIADSASLTFTGQALPTAVDLPLPVAANAALDLTGLVYHWRSHMLLGAVTVSAQGGEPPVEGNLAPIQLKNLVWGSTGLVTAEVWATAASSSQNLGFALDLGGGTGAQFTPEAALTAWTALENSSGGGYTLSAITLDPAAALVAGSHKLGILSFQTGAVDQVRLGLVAGDVGTTQGAPYAVSLARTPTDSGGLYTMTGIDPGQYALQLARDTADIGNAITSADALAALRISVGLNPNPVANGVQAKVSPYQIMAADVLGTDGRVTSADALAILRMSVKLPSAPVNEWLFVEETRDFWNEAANNGQGAFTLTRTAALWDRNLPLVLQGNAEANLVAVLKGDVNGSWAAPAGSQDLDLIAPLYFQSLSTLIGAPPEQWFA